VDAGEWLIEHRADMDRGEALWLERLAEFDRDGLWALDGQFCCATWLVWRTNMARSAFEKLRVAPPTGSPADRGRGLPEWGMSYSAARAVTRIDGPDPAVDEALVELAQSGPASIVDLERVVRSYTLYAHQERPPTEQVERARDMKIVRGENGNRELGAEVSGGR
jgi:hypothetical protein